MTFLLRSRLVLLLALATLLLTGDVARADDVGVVGAPGADGAGGAPGMPGEPGADGDDAQPTAAGPVGDNQATATGGAGGNGGATGSAGLPGGAGGDGGDATATATSTGDGDADAISRGGAGGAGGSGGAALAGNGGDALSIANAENGQVFVRATGGGGGPASGLNRTGGAGGTASAQVTRNATTNVPFSGITVELAGGAGGGADSSARGGRGGDVSLVDGVSGGAPELRVRLEIEGGKGGGSISSQAGAGGDARAELALHNAGGGEVDLDVVVRGGEGGTALSGSATGGTAGRATAGPISATSSDPLASIDVYLELRGGDGGSQSVGAGGQRPGAPTIAVDRVSASGDGSLTLRQNVIGGDGGERNAFNDIAAGGIALSELNHVADSVLLRVTSEAQGGRGGLVNGGSGGGAATAVARGTNASGDVEATATAAGGRGQVAGSNGGDATAEAVAHGLGNGSVTAIATAMSGERSVTGPIAGVEGDGMATASATSDGSGDVFAEAVSRRPSSSDASRTGPATAFGSNAGGGSVFVRASGTVATAHGESATGDVEVRAEVQGRNDPAPTSHRSEATGSTAGHLHLVQEANDGLGGLASDLAAVNAGGGSLEVDFIAAGAGLAPGVDLIVGDVTAQSTTGADVTLRATARAFGQGAISRVKLDAPQDPSVIHAESNGGAVVVDTNFELGENSSGAGDDLVIDNVASGATDGDLTIIQRGRGGSGGDRFFPHPFSHGGKASSTITRTESVASLSLGGYGLGGLAGAGDGNTPGRGGEGQVVVDATNSGGSARAFGTATGGDGRLVRHLTHSAHGGHADAWFSAATSRDGDAVLVGDTDPSVLGAVGGAGAILESDDLGARRGDGGDATSLSTGTALGDAPVSVYDRARGGVGGGALSNEDRGAGGDGGRADSSAMATTAGSSPALARSLANGGLGGGGVQHPGHGGDAAANASAVSRGQAEASASAHAGTGGKGGSAIATAFADGANGSARAESSSQARRGRVRVLTQGSVASQAVSRAESAFNSTLPDLPMSQDVQAFVFSTGRSRMGDIATALADNDAHAQLFAAAPDRSMNTLTRWFAGSDDGERDVHTEIDLVLDTGQELDQVALGVFAPESSGSGFLELRFRIEVAGAVVGSEQIFSTPAAALLFLEDSVFEVGSLIGDGTATPELRVVFDVTVGAGDSFGLGVAFSAVPEPGTGSLLLLALFFAVRGSSRRPAAPGPTGESGVRP